MPNQKRQLAAIMFTDIVGYTSLMGDNEARAMELVRKNKTIQKTLVEKHNGSWLKEMGDGTMSSFPTASDAIYCALEVQKQLNQENDLSVRIGIHLGEILSEGGDIYGDGVNIASRLQAIADPGGIYISDPVQKSVKSRSDIHTIYLGELHLKNVDYGIKTYALRGEGLPRPAKTWDKKLTGRIWAEIRERKVHRVTFAYLALSAIVISLIPFIPILNKFIFFIYLILGLGFPLALYFAWNFERSPTGFVRISSRQAWENPFTGSQKKPMTGNVVIVSLLIIIIAVNTFQYVPEKKGIQSANNERLLSVAVMPFRNDSNDPANIYFCNGIMEDVINQLSQIEGMRVPSLTSMLYYRDNPKPYTEIVNELEVSHLLEGSVRKLKNRALMTVTLIDADQNDQVWSNRYEMDLSVEGVWEIQFEVAQQIISSLQLALSNDRADIPAGSLPTASYEAYDNYLMAKDLSRSWGIEKNRRSIDLLHYALSLDPSFYLATAELSQSYAIFAELTGESWIDSAEFYAQRAFQMDPGHPESLNAMAYYITLRGDPAEGLQLYRKSRDSGNQGTNNFLGWCEWQLGNHEAALQWAFQNLKNDPNNPIYYIDISNAFASLGLFEEATVSDDKALSLNPEFTFAYENKIRYKVFMGDYQKALDNVNMARTAYLNSDWELKRWTALIQIKLGNIDLAQEELEGYLDKKVERNMPVGQQMDIFTGMALEAYIINYKGDSLLAESIFRQILKKIDDTMNPKYPPRSNIIAGCYASIGMHEEALSELRNGAGTGPFSYYYLRTLPLLDPIRGLPEYKEIMNNLKTTSDRMRENAIAKGYFDELIK
jgi:class 3 adenylate cyclase/TolB-like protein/Tfp pilus assembly protein PilF